MKIVVFDLDETLGYFVLFGIFWDCLLRFLVEYEKISDVQSSDKVEFNYLKMHIQVLKNRCHFFLNCS